MPGDERTTRRVDPAGGPGRAEKETPVLRAGSRLGDGRYRLERVVGRGGMAAVWLASDDLLERDVAIKVLSDTLIDDHEFLARFEREARVAAGLTHPNLLQIYDYGLERSRPFLVMEHVEGGDLGARLEHQSPPEPERLARELLGALRQIHAAGIVHRDIKPTNVLLDEDGSARLADFGIAQPRDATSLTQTGLVLGTARYLAPEVAAGQPASEGSDLFSLGVVLREVSDRRPASPQLEQLMAELCRRDPSQRPRSAEAALAQLEAGPVRGAPTARLEPTRPIPAAPAAGAGDDRERRRRRLALAGLAALALLAALAFAVLPSGGDEAPGEQAAREQASEPEEEVLEQAEAEPAEQEPQPEPATDADGAALNDQGYALIQQGRPDEAIPILEQAVADLEGSGDITHAYALYNLGNALRLAGRPEEAIPILERRLEIPNQRGAVRQELERARDDAGLDDDGDRGRGKGRGDDD